MIPGQRWLALLALLASAHAFLATAGQPVAAAPAPTELGAAVNNLFAQKIKLYLGSLPKQQQQLLQGLSPPQLADRLRPTLKFLYEDSYIDATQYAFVVPELGDLFIGEASMLFGNISYVRSHSNELSFEQALRLLLATLRSFDPTRFTTLLTAYPICRRAVTAFLLEHFLTSGNFSDSEGQLVLDISTRLFELHRQAAQTKRIVEFFHVSKSGGTSFCQLGRLNGCKTEGFGWRQNCLITYFRDHPRWTMPGALPALAAAHPGMREPWCARFGRQYSFKWHCKARRQHMTKNRFNIYANELVMHDQLNGSWRGVHPCREFLNVVIFREPAERVVSHMQNIIKEYVTHYNASTFFKYFDRDRPEQWRALAVPVMDNYVVRSLLGGKVFNLPGGAVNATHLLAAKLVSLQFEVLLSLSSPQQDHTRELTRDIFGLGLGWPVDLRHLHARPTAARPRFADPVMVAVRQATTYDTQLYDFALVLQGLDAIVFGAAHDLAGAGGGGGGGGGVEEAVAAAGGEGGERRQDRAIAEGAEGQAGRGEGGQEPEDDEDEEEDEPGASGGGAGSSASNGTFPGGTKRKRPRRTCGYVGQFRRAAAAAKAAAKAQADAAAPPPPEAWLAQLAAPLTLQLADGRELVVPLRLEALGDREVGGGGRWYNGTFFTNGTEAVARAVEDARAAAVAEAEVLREERNAEVQARNAVREKRARAWGPVRGKLGARGGAGRSGAEAGAEAGTGTGAEAGAAGAGGARRGLL
ncbi:hypothetical protein HXX76_009818 [Chlamydomonas incerta]|uniref:Sulfotransferase n=1 Tax=Chlamydomonas incerta TaxID=51695 RepID=A0A835VZ03_CHLIN|nr:hypothetical protein HXX76_009818 [Chlamydomonas incerta]|eukprot:KAG2430844.1 hypothetical protein HXX76_009818 [Chlamydomonas incerta]